MKASTKAALAAATTSVVLTAAACTAPAAVEKAAETVTQTAVATGAAAYLQGNWSCRLQGDELTILGATAIYKGNVATMTIKGNSWQIITRSNTDSELALKMVGDFVVDGETLKVTAKSYTNEDGSTTGASTLDQSRLGKTFTYRGIPESPSGAGPVWLKADGEKATRLDAGRGAFTLAQNDNVLSCNQIMG